MRNLILPCIGTPAVSESATGARVSGGGIWLTQCALITAVVCSSAVHNVLFVFPRFALIFDVSSPALVAAVGF